MESGYCAVYFHRACPPHDRRKLSQVRSNLAAGALLNAQRHQGTGIPERCRLFTRLFHGPSFRSFVSVLKESRNRIAPPDAPSLDFPKLVEVERNLWKTH